MQLTIENLSKTYLNGVTALDDISINIPKGMFGLLGPNGAGKSSLMRTLASLQLPDSGRAHLGDIDIIKKPEELRKTLGYLPQEFDVYPKITARDLLDHLAVLKGISRKNERKELVSHLLQKVNLYEKRNKPVKSFSGGMKQRMGIAQALIGNPSLIIVDEPTAGLDPVERNRFHNLLADAAEDVIVILSTHIVEDVNELCTNLAIMNAGRMVYHGSPQRAIDSLSHLVWQKVIDRNQIAEYQQRYAIISSKLTGGKLLIKVLSETILEDGFKPADPNLEDLFFAKVQRTNLAS